MADLPSHKHARTVDGDRRLVRDVGALDRALKHAQDVLHEHRQADESEGWHDVRDDESLEAIEDVRTLTRLIPRDTAAASADSQAVYSLEDLASDLGIALRHAKRAFRMPADRMPLGIRLRATVARDLLADAVQVLDALLKARGR